MPEGPEVRRYADLVGAALTCERITTLTARTKAACAWLAEHGAELTGRRVEQVRSHGKNLYGLIEGGYYFYAHLMMWGRWEIAPAVPDPPADRRERARIVAGPSAALLLSAPVFEVGAGDPRVENAYLASLGPDVLPYPDAPSFDTPVFLQRLLAGERSAQTIGAVLLDQQVLAGVGNYLRAEILFQCRLDPWRLVGDLTGADLNCLCRVIPETARFAYENGGATVPDTTRARMRDDAALVYAPGREWGTRHYVFRRTNLPCLVCDDTIRQLRQLTRQDEDGEKERVIYFCPTCQATTVPVKKPRPRRPAPPPAEPAEETERAAADSDVAAEAGPEARHPNLRVEMAQNKP